MGIEGERLVLDYLSRVGDLAHTTSLSASDRAALVVRLREEIGRQRASVDGDEKKSDVRRILRGVGRPEDVVAAASGDGAVGGADSGGGSGGGDSGGRGRDRGGRGERAGRGAWRGRRGDRDARDARDGSDAGGGGPEVPVPDQRLPADAEAEAALDAVKQAEEEQRTRVPMLDWQDGRIGAFVGGIEVPEMLRPPPAEGDERPGGPEAQALAGPRPASPLPGMLPGSAPAGAQPGAPGVEHLPKDGTGGKDGKGKGERPRRWRRARVVLSGGGQRKGGPIELLAVLALVAGSALGELYALGVGWLLAYWSPRLSRREAQWAVFGMPGTVVGGYVVWVVGRMNESWGAPLAEDVTLLGALRDNYPVLVLLAAVASALFLLWRARRPRPPAT